MQPIVTIDSDFTVFNKRYSKKQRNFIMSKNVFVLLTTVFVLFCVSSGYSEPLLHDDFTNGNPLINDGVGSNWQDVSQGGSLSESGGYFGASSSSGWALNAIGTVDTYELGTSFEFVLSSLSCSGDTTSTFGSPPSPATRGQASMIIIDSGYDPTTDGGNAYKASGAALEARIHPDSEGGYFFGLTASTGSNGTTHFLNDTSLVWDGSSDLVVNVVIGSDGDSYSVTAGNVSASGTLSSISGALTFSNPVYAALGIQTYSTNVVSGTYDSVTIVPEPVTFALLALGGIGVIRRRRLV